MSDPKYRPRAFLVDLYADNFGSGSAAWRLPDDFRDLGADEQQRMVWRIAGACVQHEHARPVTVLFDGAKPRYRDAADLARKWGLREKRLRLVLNGTVLMHPEDLAAFLRIAEAYPPPAAGSGAASRSGAASPMRGRPVPSELAATLKALTAQAQRQAGLKPPRDALLMTRDQEAVMEALGATDYVTIAEPLTGDEKTGHARNVELARSLVEQAAQQLRRTPGRLPENRWHTGDDNDIDIDLRRGGYPATVRGAVHDCGTDLTVWLRHDWASKVHDRGLALVDGWFVADIDDDSAEDAASLHVTVLDMLPTNGIYGHDEDGEPLGNWEYVMRPAVLALPQDDSAPTLRVE